MGKYHKLFTDKQEITGDVPIFINIGEWDEEEEKRKALDEIHEQHPNRTMIINDIPDAMCSKIEQINITDMFDIVTIFIL